MYESFKEYKKIPKECPICSKPTLSDTPDKKGNCLEEQVSCSNCKSTWRNRYVLSIVDRLKLTPAAKKILKDRQEEKEKAGDIEIDDATPSGRMLASL